MNATLIRNGRKSYRLKDYNEFRSRSGEAGAEHMKFNKNLLKEKWFSYTIALCSAVILYLLLTHLGSLAALLNGLWKVSSPVIMAFVIAYVLDPLVKLISKNVFYKVTQEKLRHTLSVVLSILTVVLFIAVLMTALVPQIIESLVTFAGNLNGYVRSFQRLMNRLSDFAASHDINLTQFISSSDELLQSLTGILPENLNKLVNVSYGFGTKLFDWIISFILAIYLMLDNQRIKREFVRFLRALMPHPVYDSFSSFWRRCNKILVRYIACDLIDGMIIGAFNWIFMVIMRMPYVAIISVIVGVTNLAPTFGPMVGAVLGAFILVLVDPPAALWFLIFTMILQTVDGYIIKPRLFGEQLGVSSVLILISLIICGRLLGVAGILLAIPISAIGDFIYNDYIIRRLEVKRAALEKVEAAGSAGLPVSNEGASGKAVKAGLPAKNKGAAGKAVNSGLPDAGGEPAGLPDAGGEPAGLSDSGGKPAGLSDVNDTASVLQEDPDLKTGDQGNIEEPKRVLPRRRRIAKGQKKRR